MTDNNALNYIKNVIDNIPNDWVKLTTHRLDIYNESLAKSQFLDEFQQLFEEGNSDQSALNALPTAFDYIRLGHPLSSVLEWGIAQLNGTHADRVISFSSKTIAILAVLRKNLFLKKDTRIVYTGDLPSALDVDVLKSVYGYSFELLQVDSVEDVQSFDGSTIHITQKDKVGRFELHPHVDFFISTHKHLGSILLVNGEQNENYIGEIQHVRRRETISMTPADSLIALQQLTGQPSETPERSAGNAHKSLVIDCIKDVTNTAASPLIGSSGLSIQYAIMMGLIDDAIEKHKGKDIKFIVPPNCYGGTNDQARRVAACIDKVEVVDLPVDGDNDMVQSIDTVLQKVALADAVPYIIAEIPTNPRVEVPELDQLKSALSKARKTARGESAIDPVFILDQTFCPNVQFLGSDGILSGVRTISYVSGSKFPSGGKCTAGYCTTNEQADDLLIKIEKHLKLCDNEATDLQLELLAEQMPSMTKRIKDAYLNTREFVNFIESTLPEAKINFVSEKLAGEGFTPSVFSLDLPTKGDSEVERESYKRALNNKLINMMIQEIPGESKYCVSYGQLKGCYWTIPATSTQGTTKEGDKDYIARVSVSPDLDLERHKEVFLKFVQSI